MKNQIKPTAKNALKVVQKNSLESIEKELVVKTLESLTDDLHQIRKDVGHIKNELSEHLLISEDEAFDLSGLMLSASWYNDECNNDGYNQVIDILLANITKSNSNEVTNCIQFLNKVAFNRSLINSIHDRTRKILDSHN